MYCKQNLYPEEDFKHCIERLFSQAQPEFDMKIEGPESLLPNILWSLYFTIEDTDSCDLVDDAPGNVHACAGPDLDLDYDESVKQVLSIHFDNTFKCNINHYCRQKIYS